MTDLSEGSVQEVLHHFFKIINLLTILSGMAQKWTDVNCLRSMRSVADVQNFVCATYELCYN